MLTPGFTSGWRLRNDLLLAHRDCRLLTLLMALRLRDCDLGSRCRMQSGVLKIEHGRDGCSNYTSRESWNERCQQPFARGPRVRLGRFAKRGCGPVWPPENVGRIASGMIRANRDVRGGRLLRVQDRSPRFKDGSQCGLGIRRIKSFEGAGERCTRRERREIDL